MTLVLTWQVTIAAPNAAAIDGAMAVDCDAADVGDPLNRYDDIQSDCNYTIGNTFSVAVHVTAAPSTESPDGYYGFQTKLAWTDAALDYLPAASAADEALWPNCNIPARLDNQPAEASVLFTCVSFPQVASTSTGAVAQFELQCQAEGTTSVALVPQSGDLQGGTHFLDAATAAIDPDLTAGVATVQCEAPAGPPDTSITGGPADPVPSNVSSPEFTFIATPAAGATFECKLERLSAPPDPGTFEPCASPYTPSAAPLADGQYRLHVQATNASGTDASPATQDFTIDTTEPETTITAGPSGQIAIDSASFEFDAPGESDESFECRLDTAALGTFAPCTSPRQYSGLAEGAYTFHVRATDTAGNTDPSPDSRAFSFQQTATNLISTVAGSGFADCDGVPGCVDGDGTPATDTPVRSPWGVATTPDGGFLITADSRIRKVGADGIITTVAGGLAGAVGVASTGDGGMLIADTNNQRIRCVTPTGIATTVAGVIDQAGYGGDGVPATETLLKNPSGVAPTADGGFLIADTSNGRVRKVAPDGTITTVAGGGSLDPGDGGPATQANIGAPTAVAPIPGAGFLIADAGDGKVRRVDAAGMISTPASGLNFPTGVAPTADGGFLVADSGNHRVVYVDGSGGQTRVAGTGVIGGFNGDGIPATDAILNLPSGVALKAPGGYPSQGGFLFTDRDHNRVRFVDSALRPAQVSLPAGPCSRPVASFTAAPNPAAIDQTVNFDASASTDPDGPIARYEWDLDGDTQTGPDGFEIDTDTVGTASRSYSAVATMTVRLRVTDGDGNTAVTTRTLVVSTTGGGGPGPAPPVPPVADFTIDPSPALVGEPVTFDGSESHDPDGEIVSYQWDLDGDGQLDDHTGGGDDPIAMRTYSGSGPVTVSLRVTDNSGTSRTTVRTLVVQEPPSASFTAAPDPALVGETVDFDALASGDPDGTVDRYEWDLDGDGSFETDTGSSPTAARAYLAPGTISVGLRVTDNDDRSATTTRTLTVQARPDASFTLTPNPVVAGRAVILDGSASSDPDGEITSYEWDFEGDGTFDATTTAGNPTTATPTYPAHGILTVRLRVTDDDNHSRTTSRTLIVQAPPAASFTASPDPPAVGDPVTFDASTSADPDGSIDTYQWDLNGNETFETETAGPTVQRSYATAGAVTVLLRVIDNDGLVSRIVSRTLNVGGTGASSPGPTGSQSLPGVATGDVASEELTLDLLAEGLAPNPRLTAPRRQRVLRLRGVIALGGCSEPCTLKLSATALVPGASAMLRSKSVTRPLAPGREVLFKLRLSKKALTAIKRALARGRRVTSAIKATAVYESGDSRTVERRVSLRR